MKFTVAAAAVVATATLASAQLGDLPSCALSCATEALPSSGCPLTDFECVCKAQSFISGLTTCVEGRCSAADVAKAAKAAIGLCASVGVPITLPNQPAPAPSSEAPAPAPSSEAPAPAPSSEAPAPAPSSEAPVYGSSAPAPAPSSHSTPCPSGVTSTVHTLTTLTTSCLTTSVPAVPVVTPPTPPTTYAPPPVHTNATVPVVPHPTAPAPPAYTGAASATKVTGSLVAIVAVVAGLML